MSVSGLFQAIRIIPAMPLAVLLSVAACGGDDIAWSDPLTLPATEGDARLLVDGRGRTRMVADTSVSVVPTPDAHFCAGSVRASRQDDGSLTAVWWSVRDDSSALLLAAVSPDGGRTWRAALRVDTADVASVGCNRPPPAISANAGFVHIAYAMHASEGVGVFYAHSMNEGKSYEPVRQSRPRRATWRWRMRTQVDRRHKLDSRFRETGDTFFATASEARPASALRPIPRSPSPGATSRCPGLLARSEAIPTQHPLVSSALAGSSEPTAPHESYSEFTRPARPMKALVADDDATTCALLCAVLDELGHDPEAVADGAAAWQRYQEAKPPLVPVRTDERDASIHFGCVTALALGEHQRIRQADDKHETFILVLTGRDQPGDLAAVLDAGADDYVAKPATAEHIRARLVIAERRSKQDIARRKAEAELAIARWRAGIGETAIALQHEINNPLAALLGHAELLLMEFNDRGEKNEQALIILEQAKRIGDVVKRIARLRNPQSVEYVEGSRMLDLSKPDDKSE